MSSMLNPRRNDHQDETVIKGETGTDLIISMARLVTEKDQEMLTLRADAMICDMQELLRELNKN